MREITESSISNGEEGNNSTEIELTHEQREGVNGMINYLKDGLFYNALKIRDAFNLSEEVISLPEVQQAAKEGFISNLFNGIIIVAFKIRDAFNLSEEILPSSEVQQAAKEGFIHHLKNKRIDRALEIRDVFGLPEEIIKQAIKEGFIYSLKNGNIGFAFEIRDYFNLQKEVMSLPEVQQAIKEGFIYSLKNGNIDFAFEIRDAFSLSEEVMSLPEVQQAAKELVVSKLFDGIISDALKIRDEINSPEIQQAAKEGFIYNLKNGNIDFAFEIRDYFNLSEETLPSSEIQQAAKEGFISNLFNGIISDALKIRDTFNLSEEVISSSEVQQAAKEGFKQCFIDREFNDAYRIQEIFNFPEGIIQKIVKEGFIYQLKKGSIYDALEIQEIFGLPEDTVQQLAREVAVYNLQEGSMFNVRVIRDKFNLQEEIGSLEKEELRTFLENMQIHTWTDLEKQLTDNYLREYLGWLINNKETCLLYQKDLIQVQERKLTYIEAHILIKQGKSLSDDSSELFRSLCVDEQLPDWQDEQNISGPFQRGADIFGYDKMFAYCYRNGLSRHDALHNFDKVVSLYQASGLSESEFYGSILFQVSKDDSTYETGTAHHELNSIANNINLDFGSVISKAEGYKEIDKMQDLLKEFSSFSSVFISWKNLKKYNELCKLLGQVEILEELCELKKEPGKDRLYHYIETLAFHPNVDMQAVFQFWRNPGRFLDVEDKHSSGSHERKKPSNYIEIPNLDLTAEDLRDALVEGSLDSLQAFTPLQIEYEFPLGETITTDEIKLEGDQRTLIKKALGSFKEKIDGEAKDPKKLFKELRDWFKKYNLDLNKFLSGEQKLPGELNEELNSLVNNSETGLGDNKVVSKNFIRYRVKTNLKSDPDGVVAGNDTACCMPFGSGKNNVYTYNPACTLLTIQQERQDGTWRTVAQSVLTKDKDVGRDIKDILAELSEDQRKNINQVLPQEVLQEGKFIIACDNVELTPNVRGHELTEQQIEMLYRDFMFEYLQRYAEAQNLDDRQVVVGIGYSDSLTNLPKIKNTYAPVAPVAYSDNAHSTCYQLIPRKAIGIRKKITEVPRKEVEQKLFSTQSNVSLLTFEDTIPVSYIEGKAYADNPTLIQYLHNMENGLIAKDISNVYKGRPNLSLKYTGDDGVVHGYLLAYEGKMNEEGEYDEESGKPIIYVSDLASDLTEKGTGRALMLALMEQYKHFYIDKGNPIPIYVQAREQTSFAILKNNLQKYGEQFGLNVEMEEVGTYKNGNDTMHQLVLRVK